jgi:hypothetical protein
MATALATKRICSLFQSVHAPRHHPIKLNASPSFSLRRLRPVLWELRTLRDVWELAARAAGNDGAYRRGTSQVEAETGQEVFPTMFVGWRCRPWSCRNTSNSLDLFVACCCSRSEPISSVRVVRRRFHCPGRSDLFRNSPGIPIQVRTGPQRSSDHRLLSAV